MRRDASHPPRLVSQNPTSQTPEATSILSTASPAPQDAGLTLLQQRIPGTVSGTIGVYLGDNILYLADCDAMRSTSSYFYDKLMHLEKDLGGFSQLQNVGAILALPPSGKPMLERKSRQDFVESLNTSTSAGASAVDSRVSSESVTIKQEDESENLSRDSLPPRSREANVRSRDAHLTLLNLMHMQDPPKLGGTFTHTLDVAKHTAELAQSKIYDCLDILRPRLASALHAKRLPLFLAIKDDPPRIAMLACAFQDESMLSEAMIHMAGCHPCWPEHWTSKERVTKRRECDGILDTVQRKAEVLRRRCELLERDLLLNTLTVDDEPELDMIRYPETWQVTQIYRATIADLINNIKIQGDEGHDISDPLRIGLVYRKLLHGGESFLPVGEVFKQLDALHFAYDHTEVVDDLQRLKEYAKGAVADICQNRLMLDVEAHDVGHLTCIDVTTDDMPWIAAQHGEMTEL